MDKVTDQLNKVRQLVFSAETGATYQQALTLTWDILRETGILLWLVVWLVVWLTIVGAQWLKNTAIDLGQKSRSWYEDIKAPKDKTPQSATAIGQSILSSLTTGTENLLYQAQQQLGMEATPPAPRPAPPKASPKTPTVSTTTTSESGTAKESAPPATTPSTAAPSDKTTGGTAAEDSTDK